MVCLSFRDIMNRSGSDSALPLSQSEARIPFPPKPFLLSSRLHPLQSVSSKASGGGGGGLEKSSSLGELRASALDGLASSCSTRSLWLTSDNTDGPAAFSSSTSSSSSGNGRGTGVQLAARRSPTQDNACEDSDASSSRRRKAFNKIFKKKHGRH